MDWLKNLLSKYGVNLGVPLSLSSLNFIANLFAAMSDGQIDTNEFHQLLASSNGIESLILFVAMIVLNSQNKNKN